METGRRHYLAPLLIGALTLAIAIGTIAVLIAHMPTVGTTPALRVGIAVVLSFLVLLIIRYFVLIWLGYLQHLEARFMEVDDTFAPPVTIIVPAYNEGPVIQSAIRSLLDLDYPGY